MTLAWGDVERITQGRIGRTVTATCPFCSHFRKRHNQRKKTFAVKIKDDGFAIFNCVHCGESGYVHDGATASNVIDLAERKRRQDLSAKREAADKAHGASYRAPRSLSCAALSRRADTMMAMAPASHPLFAS